jgi:hypothetical protein
MPVGMAGAMDLFGAVAAGHENLPLRHPSISRTTHKGSRIPVIEISARGLSVRRQNFA